MNGIFENILSLKKLTGLNKGSRKNQSNQNKHDNNSK